METPPSRSTRRRLHTGTASVSPSRRSDNGGAPGTPGPTRARIANLEKQVQELVRKYQAEQRKAEANAMEKARLTDEWTDERALLQHQLKVEGARSAALQSQADSVKLRAELNRDEIHLLATVAVQKAALAAADDDWAALEAEMARQTASAQQVTRDHALALAKSRAADLEDVTANKEAQIAALEAQLETANTSLAHQRAAESRARVTSEREGEAVVALEDQLAEKAEAAVALKVELKELKGKLAKLEDAHRILGEKEADARADIKRLGDASSKDAEKGEEVAELRAQLRAAKAAASKQEKAAEAAREETEETKAEYKDILRTLKEKYRAAKAETARLAGVEEELEALKAAPPLKKAPRKKAAPADTPEKLKKKPKAAPDSPDLSVKASKTRKTSPVADESEDEAPTKKARKSKPKALQEAEDNGQSSSPIRKPKAKAKAKATAIPADSDVETPAPAPEKKKKKRILGGAAPAFTWDPILNSGDGVIPSFLSPVSGKGSTGTIPRAGFGALGARSTRF
ncbi:hypothetical protein CspeluHIS016_0600350 [Cutaneotrichosporon spelunceum]|uniref:Uncharacterized protein n=1 Tax=Cutaneotrichosporon spelunceum TaxID=1672016 RepID=A0AAD3TXJ8_9TREE|nr:hypothetical protein CspeluHIS016_0600350 [Cutaneotrichosporon spelunceum]